MGRKKRAAAMKFVLIAALVLLLGAGVTIFVRRSQQSVSTPITSQAVADNHMIAANGPAENNADSDKTGATKVKPTEAEATKSFAEKVRKFATADGAKRIDLGTEDNANQARLHYSGSAQSERMPMINIGPSPGDFLSESASCLINKDIWLEEIPEGLRDEQSVIYYASDAPETEIIAQLHTIAVGAKKAYSGGSGYPATRNAIWSFAYDNPFGGTKYLPMLTSLKVDSSDTRLVLNDFSKSSKSSDLLKALQRQETATWHSESALSPGAIHCLTLKRDYLKPAGQDFYAHGCDRHGKLIGGAEPGSVFLVALRNGESKFVPKMYRLPASKSRVERVCVVHLPGGVSLGFMHYLFPSLLIAASILCYIISQFMKPKADRGSFYTAGDLLSLIYVVVGLLWGHFLFFAQ
jgi:hypothetical protein